MNAVTLQPAAGAQGELTGILMVRAYHRSRGDLERTEVLVPGLGPRHEPGHGVDGRLPDRHRSRRRRTAAWTSTRFRAALGPRTAAVMITNPSTLGLFEYRGSCELLEAVHAVGRAGLHGRRQPERHLGRFQPGEAGFDVMHFNVHKTFSTPHGGGGPGAGPVGVGEKLLPFLPSPRVLREPDGRFRLERPGERPSSIGRVRLVRGQRRRPRARLRVHPGPRRPRACARSARTPSWRPTTCKARVAGVLDVPFDRPCMHEFVASSATLKAETGIRTLDVAKRLIDYGYHPPTIYFPLTVEEALLIEPTETESLETLDAFAEALRRIAEEAHADPELLHSAPHLARPPAGRGDRGPPARTSAGEAMTGSSDAVPGLKLRLSSVPIDAVRSGMQGVIGRIRARKKEQREALPGGVNRANARPSGDALSLFVESLGSGGVGPVPAGRRTALEDRRWGTDRLTLARLAHRHSYGPELQPDRARRPEASDVEYAACLDGGRDAEGPSLGGGSDLLREAPRCVPTVSVAHGRGRLPIVRAGTAGPAPGEEPTSCRPSIVKAAVRLDVGDGFWIIRRS